MVRVLAEKQTNKQKILGKSPSHDSHDHVFVTLLFAGTEVETVRYLGLDGWLA